MAKAKSTFALKARAALETKTKYGDRWYAGTKARLMAAGFGKDGDFPGDPDCGRYASHTFDYNGEHLTITVRSRMGSESTYWVRVAASEEDRSRLNQARLDLAKYEAAATRRATQNEGDRYAPVIRDDDDWPPAVARAPLRFQMR